MVFRRLVIVSALIVASTASFAGPARELDPQIGRVLQAIPHNGKATFRNVSLGRESLDTLEVEPMEVWAKDAKIIVYGAGGAETTIAPPDVKYFKGRVRGEDESAVFLSRSADGSIRGMVLIGERRWALGSGVRRSRVASGRRAREDAPLLIAEIDAIDDINDPASEWECAVGDDSPSVPHARLSELSARARTEPGTDAGNVSGATYQMRLAIETDNEFSAGFGNNSTTMTTYIGDLVGKASIVYERDLSTTLIIGETHLWTAGAGTDPWLVEAGSGTRAALAEFGTYWHTNYTMASVPRSSAVFLSGKLFNEGRAWVDVLCNDDFFCGAAGDSCGNPAYANAWAGAYAFNSSLGSVTTTVPDPEATVNGVEYGLPTSLNFWMLLEFLHELGHNAGSPHSSCIALSPAEQVQYGVARAWVDVCLSGGTGCYSGATSFPAEKGTIMSYCHNFFYSGSFRASRYLFGKAGEASEKMFPVFNTAIEASTPDPTITVQTQPVACSPGRTASVPTCSGCTYAWQITGGTITSSSTISAITYTPTQTNVTLTVTVITARGCGITASKDFLSSCTPVSAPTGVIATATSASNVNVAWNPSVGALSYNVYRSTNGIAYTVAGSTTAPTTTFNDPGRTADTAYLYKVRAVNGGESGDSNIDLATTVIFTDDPLVVGTTLVRTTHITQLRTAVNAVRTLASLGAGSYTDPTLTAQVTLVKAAHVNDLRAAIDEAREILALATISYGETVTATTTTVKGSHLSELRGGVQ